MATLQNHPPVSYGNKRWSHDKTRRFTVGFVVFMVAFSILASVLIALGRTNPDVQAKLRMLTQDMMPSVRTQEWPPRPTHREIARKLTAFIQSEIEDKGIPGLTIALVDGRDIVWAKGFGRADTSAKVLTTPETVWRVASVTKLFTAVAAMQLVEQGKLKLDEPISTYVPEIRFINPFGTPITIRHLMTHRSGIVREPAEGSYFDPSNPSLTKTVASLSGTVLYFRPGTQTKYSNAAVTLLGYIIQKVSGEAYPAYIKKHILQPLDMVASAVGNSAILKPKTAKGYLWRYDGVKFQAPDFQMGIDPAAGLNTTMPDLARFAVMLGHKGQMPNGRQLLTEATLNEMWKVQFSDDPSGFGLGFYVTSFEGKRRVQHSGVQYGIATRFAALPDEQLGVTISGNLDNANAVMNRIADYALRLLLAQKAKQPLPDLEKTQAVPEAEAMRWIGYYQNDATHQIHTVRWFQKALWFHDGTHYQRIRKDAQGYVTDGRLGVGARIQFSPSQLTFNEQTYTKVVRPSLQAPQRWKEYAGEYGWEHNILFIYPFAGKLMARIEWFDDTVLHEEGTDSFAFPPDGLYQDEKVVFIRDGQGKITGVRAAGVFFKRRKVLMQPHLLDGIQWTDEENGVVYIQPQKTREELLTLALHATPPQESGKNPMDLVEPAALDRSILVDIRYASSRNFMGMRFYDQPRAFLQRPAAEALVRIHQKLKAQGLGLMIHDAYRPWYVTKMFWEATPVSQRKFVANPADGSRHNRGCAVDLTLYDLKTRQAVKMPSLYDEFSERAAAEYAGGTEQERHFRQILRNAMVAEGFGVNADEWWHFDYKDWRSYPIGAKRFEELGGG